MLGFFSVANMNGIGAQAQLTTVGQNLMSTVASLGTLVPLQNSEPEIQNVDGLRGLVNGCDIMSLIP